MPREITGARDCLMQLNTYFPEKEKLTKKDVCGYFGICRNTLRKYFPELWQSQFILKSDLAKLIAKKGLKI